MRIDVVLSRLLALFSAFQTFGSNSFSTGCELLVAQLPAQLVGRSLQPAACTGPMDSAGCTLFPEADILVEHSETVSCVQCYRSQEGDVFQSRSRDFA